MKDEENNSYMNVVDQMVLKDVMSRPCRMLEPPLPRLYNTTPHKTNHVDSPQIDWVAQVTIIQALTFHPHKKPSYKDASCRIMQGIVGVGNILTAHVCTVPVV
jgi:hypothetical protein